MPALLSRGGGGLQLPAMNPQNLLVELFVEELPPKALPALGESFARTLAASLQSQGLAASDVKPTPYASPRRLAVRIPAVAAKAADKAVAQKLMPVAVGLDADGKPTPALLKKLGALGLDADAAPRLRREGEGKAETLFIDTVAPGATLAEGLQKALAEAIAKLPIPKVMAYQLEDGWTTVKFVRPAHGLVALHGADVVPVQALGLTAGRETHGHRFEAQADPIVLRDADSYADQLREQGAVIASFDARRAEIAAQLQAAARQAGPGLHPIDDAALLDEVTALVERPNVLLCQFDPAFLAVPQECLILTMKANQKYFPLLDAAGKLTHRFLVVSNISPADPSAVIEGNERVVRPRLADAQFFFEQDRKKRLEDRVPGLDKVVYHARLGSQGERMRRVQALAGGIARQIPPSFPVEQAERAALLAKTDLLTDMVGEFPELQGIMGRYYAAHDGEDARVAEAIEDHYKPRFSGDDLPRSDVGFALALADKTETLVGLFGIGERPTGDKDPFALRRHTLGILRMLMERGQGIELSRYLENAVPVFSGVAGFSDPSADVQTFLYDRLANLLREQGWTAQEVDAVLALSPQILANVPRRLEAVRAFAALPEAAALAAANKRVGNILRKSEGAKDGSGFNADLLVEPAEIALSQALNAVAPQVQQFYAAGDYTAALKMLAALKVPVDTFFDQVMVNAEDPALRANRLALLARLQEAMNQVADLSRLAA
ncbi:glycine tRNA synthetase, beta subunit [Thiomonas arsenitoxydans]|uniref:Glycine--tRNA ligase beta subunit n=2 Tax=Thiomonas arsenitoxydans (strain DSM 22701 / CIP 110005 / 3As) TaxID=426114 RepID=D6CVK9_THIA3|nr:glycine tRNA synthetase, beta subunit glyS [Thiomonas arsenitoxydans]CQR28435.1 glycine tRNA synthetase, beta subunit [Thiomonas arsenitoxydans]CQR28436.1 glycine tRNA synthetase, beta subunit [Thiomonas arsenitoxydans]CQR28453.1 glycine tRNA synthetase, beta subunit [Thiomonas arsenitoxydans]CQR30889.1 glycine tRNA synthetase, beta subunit [Thiomonas arsenitoxydans]